MSDKVSLREFLARYEAGEFNDSSFETMVRAGWYDWFCKTESLRNRLKKIYVVLKGISNPYVLDNYWVWFKNNCPITAPLYDDVRFEPFDEGLRDSEYFVVGIDDKRESTKYQVWTSRTKDDELKTGSVRNVWKFINSWPETKKEDFKNV